MTAKPKKPRPPKGTSADVRAEFTRLVALMGDRAVEADEIALLMLATSWDTWKKARAEVQELGNVVLSGGTAIANPSLAIAHQAHTQILALSKELGLTPASRKKVAPDEEEDAWAALDDADDDLDEA